MRELPSRDELVMVTVPRQEAAVVHTAYLRVHTLCVDICKDSMLLEFHLVTPGYHLTAYNHTGYGPREKHDSILTQGSHWKAIFYRGCSEKHHNHLMITTNDN